MTWVMWNLTSFHLKTVLVLGQIGPLFAPNIPLAQKSFWTHPLGLLGYEAQVKARFSPFGDSANLDAR